MSCCCNNVLNVGCFCVGLGFALDFAAPADGLIYTLILGFHQVQIRLESEPTVTGEAVQFLTNALNPFYGYEGKLYDDNGDFAPLYDADGNLYDCIAIKPQAQGFAGKSIPLTLTI